MDSKEDDDNYDTTQSIASTCIDMFGNICTEVVDVADELLTTITNTPDAIYELSLMYSSQEESHDNDNAEDLSSPDLSQVKVKVEDSIYENMSLDEIKSDDLDSQELSKVKTKIEDPISQISSQVNSNTGNLVSQDLIQVKVKVEDSIYENMSLGEIKSDDLDSQESSQVKTKIEDPISQISSQVNSNTGNLVSQDLIQVKVKVEDSIYENMSLGEIKSDGRLDSQESSHFKTNIEDPISQISSHVNSNIGNLISQGSNSDSTITMSGNVENLNSYAWSSDGYGDVSLKLRDNNEVNSSYSSQNESSLYSSSLSEFQDDSFNYSSKTASSSSTLVKSFDRDFFWVTKELDDNAYEVCNAKAIGLVHKKELNMVSKLKSLKIDNDKINMKSQSMHLEDEWDDNLIQDDESESLASKKSNKKTTYKKKMKSVLTSPKFLISKMKSSSVNGVEQVDPRHHQIPLPIKECSIDFDWEVL